MWKDPIVEEVHKIRDLQSSKYNYDVKAMIKALKKKEAESERQFVAFPPKSVEKDTA